MWLFYAFVSAALLGVYDVSKKIALNKNAVIPVLFFTTLFNFLLMFPLFILSMTKPETMQQTLFYIPPQDLHTHFLYMLKAMIVLSSWVFAYFAMKHLPITIASPIKATQPVLVLLGALLLFREQLNIYQWIGVLLTIISFYFLSSAGKKEGIVFKHNVWIFCIIMATVTGAISGLYDKYLMKSLVPMAVQAYYNFYQLIIMVFILLLLWYPQRAKSTPFKWSWAIPCISVFLSMADFVYFYALSFDDSMISIVSMVRRSSVIVSFIFGALLLGEHNLKRKAIDLILILIGMFFLYLGSK